MLKSVQIIFSILITTLTFQIANAQNKATVTQQGSGNKASIIQGEANKITTSDCEKAYAQAWGPRNEILLRRGAAKKDTLLFVSGNKLNFLSDILYMKALTAYQYGTNNGILVILPDTQRAPMRFNADQNGSMNRIIATAGKTPSDFSLNQKGDNNFISLNSCSDRHLKKDENGNSVHIQQKGSQNSVHVTQN